MTTYDRSFRSIQCFSRTIPGRDGEWDIDSGKIHATDGYGTTACNRAISTAPTSAWTRAGGPISADSFVDREFVAPVCKSCARAIAKTL